MTTQTLSRYEVEILADVTGCDSTGNDWLTLIYESYLCDRRHYDDAELAIHELADGAVPIYTIDLWRTFVGVNAWSEDISDFGPIADLEQAARTSLYLIAERLLRGLEESSAQSE
jgi:hypothetical protein